MGKAFVFRDPSVSDFLLQYYRDVSVKFCEFMNLPFSPDDISLDLPTKTLTLHEGFPTAEYHHYGPDFSPFILGQLDTQGIESLLEEEQRRREAIDIVSGFDKAYQSITDYRGLCLDFMIPHQYLRSLAKRVAPAIGEEESEVLRAILGPSNGFTVYGNYLQSMNLLALKHSKGHEVLGTYRRHVLPLITDDLHLEDPSKYSKMAMQEEIDKHCAGLPPEVASFNLRRCRYLFQQSARSTDMMKERLIAGMSGLYSQEETGKAAAILKFTGQAVSFNELSTFYKNRLVYEKLRHIGIV